MRVSLYNTLSNLECFVEIPDNIANDIENTVLIFDHDSGAPSVFKIISTIPDKVKDIRNLQHEFINKEFPELEKKFNFKSGTDIPSDFVNAFAEAVEPIIQEKYPEFYKAIEEKKDSVYASLSMNFVGTILSKLYADKEKEEIKPKDTGCFLLDYAEFCGNCFKNVSIEDTESIYILSNALNMLQTAVDANNKDNPRRKAGYYLLVSGMNMAVQEMVNAFSVDSNDPEKIISKIKSPEDTDAKKEIQEKLKIALDRISDYFNVQIPNQLKNTAESLYTLKMRLSKACLTACWRAINDLGTELERITTGFEKEDIEPSEKAKLVEERTHAINRFSLYFEMIVATCDYLKLTKDEFTESIDKLWKHYDQYINAPNKDPNIDYYSTFLKACCDEWDELFAPLTLK